MITTTYPRFESDTAAPFIASIAEGIAALGHSVDVVLPFHPKLSGLERNGVRLHPYRLPGDSKKPLWGYAQSMEADVAVKKKVYALAPLALHKTFWSAAALASKEKFDLIHAHWVLPNGFPAALLARRLKLPLVISLHGSDMFLARKSKLMGRFAGFTFRKAAAITACSPDLQEQAEKLSDQPVWLLPYGVDIEHFKPANVTRDPHSIFAVGRLVHKKGFAQLIEAFFTVIKYYMGSTLTIAGDGPLFSQLKQKTENLGIAASVNFVGNVDRDRLPDFYRAAEIIAVPSVTDAEGNRDGLPNVFLEALSSGSAVIASDIPGIQSVIGSGNEAVLVPSGDVAALAAGIQKLFENSLERERLRIAAREKAVRELAWEVRSKELEKIYKELITETHTH